MSTVTPNFNWPVPTSTDLVKDGATAIEALGDSIDASFVDLKGGTTGQVLAKASNTDLDYTWTSPTTGDITGVTAGTGLTGGGTSGTVSLSFDIANYGGGQWAAGKNKVINGNFGIWQRGTSFSLNASAAYTADRWYANCANTVTVSQQTFTPGTAPVAGYEGQYFLRFNRTARPTIYDDYFINRIEDVRTFAGQTVTMSFWAKTNSGTTTLSGGYIEQNFGSGGSSTVYTGGTAPLTLTTSWQRFEAVVTMPSIAGKTIGTGSYVTFNFAMANSVGTSAVYDIWGCQLEAGSTATPFQTATGTIAGELAACQRYYEKSYAMGYPPTSATQEGAVSHPLIGTNNTGYFLHFRTYKVEKRATPTITIYDYAGNSGKCTVISGTTTVGTDNITVYTDTISSSSFRIYQVGTSSGGFGYQYTASAEL